MNEQLIESQRMLIKQLEREIEQYKEILKELKALFEGEQLQPVDNSNTDWQKEIK